MTTQASPSNFSTATALISIAIILMGVFVMNNTNKQTDSESQQQRLEKSQKQQQADHAEFIKNNPYYALKDKVTVINTENKTYMTFTDGATYRSYQSPDGQLIIEINRSVY